MIIRSIIEKIRKDLREEHPDLTPEQIEIVAMNVYYEYQRIVFTGETPPAGVLNYTGFIDQNK